MLDDPKQTQVMHHFPEQLLETPVFQKASPELLRQILKLQNDVMTAGLNLNQVMQTIVSRSIELIHSDGAVVELLEGEEMVYKAVAGPLLHNTLGLRLKANASLSGQCVREDDVLYSEDIESDPRVDRETCRKVGLRSMLTVPLRTPRGVAGVLKIISAKPSAFGEKERSLLTLMASALATALKNSEEATERAAQLKESEDKFRTITDAMPQMVWSADAQGHHDFFNRQWYLFTGVPEGSTDGEKWSGLFHPDDQEMAWRQWRASLATGAAYEVEYRLRHFSGEYRWTLGRALPIRDSDGKIIRWMGTCTDIHDRKLAAVELARAKDEAERASELKSAFLANMSHEIRTPLGAMLGFADLLRDPALSESERASYIDILVRNGNQLSILIDDILDLSKVEAGHVALEYSDFSPEQIARDVVSLLSVECKDKDLVLEYTQEDSTPLTMVSDPVRVRQILLNLVGNAIKFTHRGRVQLRSFGCRTASGHIATFFDIEDTGIGIPASQRDQVFEAFVQADAFMTRRFGGTGLGLSLSRRLARAIGGEVEIVQTEEGKGTLIRFTIENKDVATKASVYAQVTTLPKRTDAPQGALKGLSILVVDDSPDNQQLITRYLTKQGAIVNLADNGAIGVRRALDGDYHLILMDIQMPEMDGYTATQTLRQAGWTKPIIAVTAHAMAEVRSKCLNAGCTDYLVKPLNSRDLIQAITRHIESAC